MFNHDDVSSRIKLSPEVAPCQRIVILLGLSSDQEQSIHFRCADLYSLLNEDRYSALNDKRKRSRRDTVLPTRVR